MFIIYFYFTFNYFILFELLISNNSRNQFRIPRPTSGFSMEPNEKIGIYEKSQILEFLSTVYKDPETPKILDIKKYKTKMKKIKKKIYFRSRRILNQNDL